LSGPLKKIAPTEREPPTFTLFSPLFSIARRCGTSTSHVQHGFFTEFFAEFSMEPIAAWPDLLQRLIDMLPKTVYVMDPASRDPWWKVCST
jgi:hypothetical protein